MFAIRFKRPATVSLTQVVRFGCEEPGTRHQVANEVRLRNSAVFFQFFGIGRDADVAVMPKRQRRERFCVRDSDQGDRVA